jgi:hypothetical protein
VSEFSRRESAVPIPDSISGYLRTFTSELGERILESFPPLHAVDVPPSPMIRRLLRRAYPAQILAIMGLVRRWQQARAGAVIAECGTGKTLISLGAVHTQASRRSWRIGQRNNVNVKFFYYAGTMQEACLRLMGKKLLVSLAMEGKFASDGLQAIDQGDDILMAMAREPVTEKGIGEGADAVWKQLVEKQAEVFGVRATDGIVVADEPRPAETEPEEIVVPPSPLPSVVTQLLMFGSALENAPKRKGSRRVPTTASPSSQLALF